MVKYWLPITANLLPMHLNILVGHNFQILLYQWFTYVVNALFSTFSFLLFLYTVSWRYKRDYLHASIGISFYRMFYVTNTMKKQTIVPCLYMQYKKGPPQTTICSYTTDVVFILISFVNSTVSFNLSIFILDSNVSL